MRTHERVARALRAFPQPMLPQVQGKIVELAEKRSAVQRQGVRGLQGTQSGEALRLGDERGVRMVELQPVAAEQHRECHPGGHQPACDCVAAKEGGDRGARTRRERGEGQVGFTDL